MEMEVGRQILRKLQRRKKPVVTSALILPGLEVHFYLPDTQQIIHLKGRHSAEQLCTEAAKKLNLSPLCSSLFALYDETNRMWFPPNHVFLIDETTRLRLHYRMRFYFTNWHGTNKETLAVVRHSLKSSGNQGTALLDSPSLSYLYAQSQYDFQTGSAALRSFQSEEEAQHIENECLGMAVMAISHDAMGKNLPARELAKRFKYKNYIPVSLNQSISQRNLLTRLRISNVFKAFLEEFNDNTVLNSSVSKHDLKVKYVSTLETLTRHFGCEVYQPLSVRIHENDEVPTGFTGSTGAGRRVIVSGTGGIKWQVISPEIPPTLQRKKSKRNKRQHGQPGNTTRGEDWTMFSDFHEITHIVIKEAAVTVYRQDDGRMEVCFSGREEALAFASLIDSYFRLTVDAHHFLCTEVAPVSVETNLREGCHGPISTDYAVHKLKQEGYEEGMYILRWSCANYDHVLLTVICNERDASGEIMKTFKNFQIERTEGGFRLCGTELEKPTLRELTDRLCGHCLSTDNTTLKLARGCPPQPRELSNLLMMTRPDSVTLPTPSTVFNRINKEDIVQDVHLGKGTRTNIFSGTLRLKSDKDSLISFNSEDVPVVLKVIGAGLKDVSGFFETVSQMHQVSHKHMTHLYGICLHSMDIIMVEEFVQHGPLDLFMRAHHADLTPSWKFQVAEQLASALSYLEDKKLVHGFVCTKNILLAKDGLEGHQAPFIKLSQPGASISALNREECIDRIPWIAPECVKNPKAQNVAADKWGFGTTLWEICYNGDAPLRDKKRAEKEWFYEAEGALVITNCSELAELITQCMNYDPRKRPFFRAIVRELDRIKEQNPAMVSGDVPVQEIDPTMFESRFLKSVRDLGEGHFGKVELCLYDPHGDHNGQLVAVKSLKSETEGAECSNLRREINTMRELYHNNIVKYKGICTEEGGRTIKLIMEYLPAGSLKDYLPRHKAQTNQKRLMLYAMQICQGMDYLGSQNYIHRDLAARNVLVENETLVKIGDFGLTKSIKDNEEYYTVREEQDSPVYWYAPECLIHRKFYKASDVWSFGVTLYELMTYCDRKMSPPEMFLNTIGRSHGQMTMARLVKALEGGWRLSIPPSCPDIVYTQMRRCWAPAPEDRVDFKALIEVFERLLSSEELSLVRSC
ncbi:tyrosine-protein kinase JAK1-like [Clarias gariepinus]|uniref:tyrosine-protein kinase JAK1-like n=1 Tax=Clarias gariepinus TaxID=13013 RepID=UPI00234C583E|nr:tyrosine-protein kinase JAK1-like [Clarias gariepinus]